MILLIDKPAGMTSQAVVSRIKRAMGHTQKVGHTGTLDPMCTGLLPVLIGADTKLTPFFPHEKTYRAVLRFGVATDTGDVTGTPVAFSDLPTKDRVCAALSRFIGPQRQIPPMYSAVHINGKRLYELARAGQTVKREPRRIEIFDITYLSSLSAADHEFTVTCSGGTYIRTLCEDIAASLGLCGTMAALRRTRANGFSVENACSLETAVEYAEQGNLAQIALSAEDALAALPSLCVPADGERYYQNGGVLTANRCSPRPRSGLYRAYSEAGAFLGLARVTESDEVKAAFAAR